MALTTKCPKCGQTIKATEDLMGKTIRCPEWDETFSVDEIDIHADETHATAPEATRRWPIRRPQRRRPKNVSGRWARSGGSNFARCSVAAGSARSIGRLTQSCAAKWPSRCPAPGPVIVRLLASWPRPRPLPGCPFCFSLDPKVTAEQILEVFADRVAIQQDLHNVKEVWGAGQQQVRHLWATNIGAWHLNLWMHTLVERWPWKKRAGEICDRRASPWDDPTRRPSHADRRKTLRRWMLRAEYTAIARGWQLTRKIGAAVWKLLNLAA